MRKNMKEKVISGLIWRFAERMGAQGVQFIISVVLARILTPSDYGIVGLTTVFISIATTFISAGFGQALIQKKDVIQKDYSSVFYFNIAVSLALYIILFFAAPLIADFYNNELLVNVLRVLAVTLIIGAVNGVQQAYVQKTMQFRKFFVATLGGTIASGVAGIVVALKGGGVWAIVTQQLMNQVMDTVILWIMVKWRPTCEFSLKRMLEMLRYGWKLLCSSLLDNVYNNIYSLIIGKFYSTADLGYYNKGKSYPFLVINNINSSIDMVLFPALSELQSERERLKQTVRRSIVTSTFIIFPAMAGLAAIAEPLLLVLVTEKWLPAVPFLRFCCFTYAFWPVHTANLQAIKALGRSDIFLKLEIIKKMMGITVLSITLPHGLMVMMTARCITTVISSFINAYPNKKLLGYTYWEQVKDMAPSFIISIVMAVAILTITLLPIAPILQMVIQIVIGVVVYFGLAKLFKLECLGYVLNTLKGFINRKKG